MRWGWCHSQLCKFLAHLRHSRPKLSIPTLLCLVLWPTIARKKLNQLKASRSRYTCSSFYIFGYVYWNEIVIFFAKLYDVLASMRLTLSSSCLLVYVFVTSDITIQRSEIFRFTFCKMWTRGKLREPAGIFQNSKTIMWRKLVGTWVTFIAISEISPGSSR